MGNQQALTNYNYYSFTENDSDSGFGDLSSSPFEFTNNNTTFDYLYETDKQNKSKTPSSKTSHLTKTKSTDSNLTDDEEEVEQLQDNLDNKHELHTPKIPKSKSFGIKIIQRPNSYDFDENNNDISINNTKPSIISSSWSPNSSILTNQNKVLKKTIEERVTSTPKIIPKSENNYTSLTPTPTPISVTTTTTPTKNASTYPLSFLSGMNFVGRVARGVKELYNEINPATLTGAIDVVVVQQEDGSFRCSPFHVRFGKLGVIRSKEKIVEIEINGQKVDDLHMILGEAGEAFFIEKVITDADNNEYVTACDLANITVPELSALIAASSTTSATTLKSTESNITTTTSTLNTTKSTENLNSEKTLTESKTVKSILSASVSSVDLTVKDSNDSSIDKTLVQTPTTPIQPKSLPIPIVGSILNDVNSSTPLTINTDTTSVSPNIIISPESDKQNNSSSTNIASTETGAQSDTVKPNFFSDGELTPELTSPAVSRPPTPKSDTELEVYTKIKRANTSGDILNQWNWQWGELPSRQQNHKNSVKFSESESTTNSSKQLQPQLQPQQQTLKTPTTETPSAKSPSKILGMFNLMGTKSENKDGGIYLDETEKLDSEVAALYLDQKSNSQKFLANQSNKSNIQLLNKDDDQESGNGQSLPQSPVKDFYSIIGDVQLSLCGFVFNTSDSMTGSTQQSFTPIEPANFQQIVESPNFDDLFQQYAVSYDKFMEEYASITMNSNLVFKINNKYMTWQSAAPIILSAVVFQKGISNETNSIIDSTNKLVKQQQQAQEPQQTQPQTRSTSFLGKLWGKTKPQPIETITPTQPTTLTTINAIQKQTTTTTTTTTVTTTVQTNIQTTTVENSTPSDNEYGMVFNSDPAIDSSIEINSTDNNLLVEQKPFEQIRYRKTTRLSSELIEKLNLQPGSNEIQFSVTTALQGTTRITSYIFLWNYDDKIIVSDIDGTITKSDVWGQVLPIFGRDWSQAGVADLFTAIERNHYKFMYLSARAIGQSKITRDLLRNINQDGFTLPEGPLLVTPTSLFQAFQKEVIEKKPEEFKISCLKDIQSLFPYHNPYYAGYGNKTSDVKAYKTVGIQESRIFTINPQGEVKHEVSGAFQSSYSKLCDYVDLIFPSFNAPLEIKAEYDSFHYWRDPTPLSIMDEIEQELADHIKDSKDTKDDSKKDKRSSSKLKAQASVPIALSKINSSNSIAEAN